MVLQAAVRRLLDDRDYPPRPLASLKEEILKVAKDKKIKVEGIAPKIKTKLLGIMFNPSQSKTLDERAKIIELLTHVFVKEGMQEKLLRTMWSDARPKTIATHGEEAIVVDLLRSALASKELQAVTQAIDYVKDTKNAVNIEALLKALGHNSK